MSNVALHKDGHPVLASAMFEADWQALKESYAIGDFVMPCCQSSAILKTSPNGLHFFAHRDDECATAPETRWHREGKALIVATLADLGYECREEVAGGEKKASWQADTYFEVRDRKIVIELQRSYQHLRDFLRRQERYEKAGIESYWLIRPENSPGLIRTFAKFRLKRDFGGKFPDKGFFPYIQELPMADLETGDSPVISGAMGFQAPIKDWLIAVIEKRFRWDNGAWLIV